MRNFNKQKENKKMEVKFVLEWDGYQYDYPVDLTDAQIEALANQVIEHQMFSCDVRDEDDFDDEDVRYVNGVDELWLFPDKTGEHGFFDFVQYDGMVAMAVQEILPDIYNDVREGNSELYDSLSNSAAQYEDLPSLDEALSEAPDNTEKLAELCAEGCLFQFRHIPEEVFIKAREIVEREWTKVDR